VLLSLPDGRRLRREFYRGAGYWSQSSASVLLPAGVEDIRVWDLQGQARQVVGKPDGR